MTIIISIINLALSFLYSFRYFGIRVLDTIMNKIGFSSKSVHTFRVQFITCDLSETSVNDISVCVFYNT